MLLALASLLCPALSQAQGRLERVGQLGGPSIAVAASPGRAYLGVGPRLLVFDVSDPSNLRLLGQTDVLPDIALSLDVEADFAYAAAGYSGLLVIDVRNPEAPAHIGGCDTPDRAWDLDVFESFAYVASGGGGLQVIDVSDRPIPCA